MSVPKFGKFDATGKWIRTTPITGDTMPLQDIRAKDLGPDPSKWKAYKLGELGKIKARINLTNLNEPSKKSLPNVKFLRSGKQWGVIVG